MAVESRRSDVPGDPALRAIETKRDMLGLEYLRTGAQAWVHHAAAIARRVVEDLSVYAPPELPPGVEWRLMHWDWFVTGVEAVLNRAAHGGALGPRIIRMSALEILEDLAIRGLIGATINLRGELVVDVYSVAELEVWGASTSLHAAADSP